MAYPKLLYWAVLPIPQLLRVLATNGSGQSSTLIDLGQLKSFHLQVGRSFPLPTSPLRASPLSKSPGQESPHLVPDPREPKTKINPVPKVFAFSS